jgi:DNA-binding Lrp family transcriptional regulator
MPASNNKNISDEEKKIINELLKNAKENTTTIAKRCNVSDQKVRKTIHQLEENQLIWGYSAIIDEEKLGLKHYVMMVKRSNKKIDDRIIDQIISRKIEDITRGLGITIENSFYTHGEYDWILTFTAHDILQARKFADTLSIINEGIIQKIIIVQTLMFVRKQYILNPERTKLKKFL